MANYADKIFEMLGINPGNEFGLKEHPTTTFKINSSLELLSRTGVGDWHIVNNEILLNILNGRLNVQKYVFTSNEMAVLKACWIMGYKYIAKDGNGTVWTFADEPKFNPKKEEWFPSENTNNGAFFQIKSVGNAKLFENLTSCEKIFIGDLTYYL